MKETCLINYKDAVFKISTTKQKLKQKEYLQIGEIPVIDQGQEIIGGYTNDKNKVLVCTLPVIVFGDHTKNVKLINFPFAPGADGTKVLQPKKHILPKYLSYITEVLVFKIKDNGYARHYQLIEKEDFPLVSVPEQKAIVKKIEELFSSLDSGIADLKKAQDQLKIYRQAVLSSSFPKKKKIEISKLVEDLSQGWSPKCINKNSTDSTEWAVIKTSAIQAGKFVEIENKILPDTLEPREQHEIKKGDILITRAGPRVRVGICCLVKKTRPKLINCDKVYRIKLNQVLVTPEYFEYALNSPEILSEIEIMKSGSNDSGLNLTQKVFLKLQIPYVKIEEQTNVVQEIESRLSVCDTVEKDIANSLEKANALRQSILKKAFEGKLLSEEEITKCNADKDYEPASVLLKKIKAEKKQK